MDGHVVSFCRVELMNSDKRNIRIDLHRVSHASRSPHWRASLVLEQSGFVSLNDSRCAMLCQPATKLRKTWWYLISFVQLTNITEWFNDIDFLWLSGLFKRHALIFSSWCYCMSKYKQSMDKVIRYPEEPTLLVQKHHHNHPPLPTCRQRWSLPWQPGTEWCRLHSTFGSRMWVQHVRLRNMAKFRAVFELFLTLLSSPA